MEVESKRHIASIRNTFENCYLAPSPDDEIIDLNDFKLYPTLDGGIFYLRGYLIFFDEECTY